MGTKRLHNVPIFDIIRVAKRGTLKIKDTMNVKPITIKAYIGSNNKTKELEVEKILTVVNKNHDGFTLDYPVTGYWKGEPEDTAILYLADATQKVLNTLEELKEVLDQEAIAYQIEMDMHFI